MKKIIVSILAAMVLAASSAVVMTGCGGAPASIEGTWEVTESFQNGQDMLALAKSMYGDDATMTIEFKDGKMSMSAMGDTEDLGSYIYENGKLKTGTSDNGVDVKVTGNTMTMEFGGSKLVMKKK